MRHPGLLEQPVKDGRGLTDVSIMWRTHWHGVVHWAATRQERRRPIPPFSDRLEYVRTVARDPAGRPGYTVRSTAAHGPVRYDTGEGVRTDIVVLTGTRSRVIVTCGGPVAKLHPAEERMREGLAHVVDRFDLEITVPVHEGTVAGERAFGFTARLRGEDGAPIEYTDWMFDHDGWAFTLGTLGLVSELATAKPLADGVVASWTWLPA